MASKIQVLYIDDDLELSSLVEEYLSSKDVEVKLLHDPNQVIPSLQTGTFDLCLMDVKMPEKDGFTLAEEIVQNELDIPFIFLTGQTRKEDRIHGLKLGAADFISKPFSLEELYLRIQNIFKRVGQDSVRVDKVFTLGSWEYHPDFGELRKGDETVSLSSTEARVLHFFCQNMNKLVQRSDILLEVWGEDDYYKGLSLNVYITRLRKRFTDEPAISIVNEHGQGYKFMIKAQA